MANSILGLIPTMQSVALLSENIPRKKNKKGIVELGLTNIVGLPLIRATAQLI